MNLMFNKIFRFLWVLFFALLIFLDRDIKEYRTLFKSPILTKDKGLLINDGVLRKIDYCSNLLEVLQVQQLQLPT